MASLNHVCMWSKHGWIRVTAEEVAKKQPGGTVSSQSGLFMCELCGQYVTFTDGEKHKRYFKHSKYEEDKSCPERTFGATYIPTYTLGKHELPIRLKLEKYSFLLEIGLLYVPENILNRQAEKSVTITNVDKMQFTYSFERLNTETITYLSIGKEPSSEYTITASKELVEFWPKKVKGISKKGAVFDKRTGKMLSTDDDVQVNKKYLLLISDSYMHFRETKGVEINKVCENRVEWRKWCVYEVEATELSESAARFFQNLRCRLTDSPINLNPIWPIHVKTPFVIKHNRDEMILHISGNRQSTPKTFPHASVKTCKCLQNGQVAKIACNERQQLISACSAYVLQYLYLWKEPLSAFTRNVDVNINDDSGATVSEGIQNAIPEGRLLRIVTPFDGYVIIRNNESDIIEKIIISANERMTIPDLKYGMNIQVLQGLDIVWQSTFIRLKKNYDREDEIVLSKLISLKGSLIPVRHSLAALAVKFKEYPKTRQWLIKTIKRGSIPEKSIKYLRKYIVDMPEARKGKAK